MTFLKRMTGAASLSLVLVLSGCGDSGQQSIAQPDADSSGNSSEMTDSTETVTAAKPVADEAVGTEAATENATDTPSSEPAAEQSPEASTSR